MMAPLPTATLSVPGRGARVVVAFGAVAEARRRWRRRRRAWMLAGAAVGALACGVAGWQLSTRPTPPSGPPSGLAKAGAKATDPSSGPTSNGGVAPMYAIGYTGVEFTPSGQAILSLEDGRTVTVPASVGQRILHGRAEEGLPPLPVTGAPPGAVSPMGG